MKRVFLVLVCSLFLGAGWASASGLLLPQTGQTMCYDGSGNPINCANTRQDGALRSGVTWPNPRFVDNNNGTVVDKLTNLVWTKNADAPDSGACGLPLAMNWQQALDYITCLNTSKYLGVNDWALPNVIQLSSLINFQKAQNTTWLQTVLGNDGGFENVQVANYWTNDTYVPAPGYAWVIAMEDGARFEDDKLGSENHVWPVRIAPDLVVTSIGAPATAATGAQVTIPVTVKNVGIGSTLTSSSRTNLYLSSDNTITGTDTYLAWAYMPVLVPGQEVTLNYTVTLPQLAAGTYYFGVIADATASIIESDETNNATAADEGTQVN